MTMKSARLCAMIVFLATVVCICEASQFAADVRLSSGGSNTKQLAFQKVYVKDQRQRIESYSVDVKSGEPVLRGGPTTVDLLLMDKGLAIHLCPAEKEYAEKRISKHDATQLHAAPPKGSVGKEMISGFICHKYVNTAKLGGGKVTVTTWWSPELDYDLKTVTVSSYGTLVVVVSNINRRALPDSLFIVPSNYKKINKPKPVVGPSHSMLLHSPHSKRG